MKVEINLDERYLFGYIFIFFIVKDINKLTIHVNPNTTNNFGWYNYAISTILSVGIRFV